MSAEVEEHNKLVLKIGAALEATEVDKANCAMLETMAIGIVEAAAGDPAKIDDLRTLTLRTLDAFLEVSAETYMRLKTQGKR